MDLSALRLRLVPSLGGTVVVALSAGYVLLWLLAQPAHEPTGRYIGQFLGAEAVLLLSCALVLATVLPPIERAFDGLDRVAIWHRGVATIAVLLLVPHRVLVASPPDPYATGIGPGLGTLALLGLVVLAVWALAPRLRAARWPGRLVRRLARASYEHWLTAHRLTGLFVIAAVAHGVLVAPALRSSNLLRIVYLAIGSIGVAAYIYRELFARYFIPAHDYTVSEVRWPNETTTDVSLEPVHEPLDFVPGQFVVLSFGGVAGWQRHPFSVTSAPAERRLGVSIKAVGDYTRDLHDALRPGTPAKVVGPFGTFDYQRGGTDQIWIAGGIGITPFISWIRSLDDSFDRRVDFYYSVRGKADALYLDEIEAAAARHPTLHLRLVETDRDGLLTAEQTAKGHPADVDLWVYMCGPPAMMTALDSGFRALRIPAGRVRWEQFDIR
jgi:predicted ferric reductase